MWKFAPRNVARHQPLVSRSLRIDGAQLPRPDVAFLTQGETEFIEAMGKILRESKRISQLIDNLLLLARADSDDQVLKPDPVLVNSALRKPLIVPGRLRPAKTSRFRKILMKTGYM